jgi:hypothetical protein
MSDTQARLDAYKAAELAVLKGQSVRYGERMLTMADLSEIRKAIAQLTAQLTAEQGRSTTRGSLVARTVVF